MQCMILILMISICNLYEILTYSHFLLKYSHFKKKTKSYSNILKNTFLFIKGTKREISHVMMLADIL